MVFIESLKEKLYGEQTYPDHSQTRNVELFVIIDNGLKP